MKLKICFILMILFIYAVGLVDSFQQSGTDYDTLYYFGSGGFVETTATKDIAGGIGQTVIGEINSNSYNYAIQYGIFYLNVTYTIPAKFYLPIGINIEDFGIEWVKLNWTM